MALSRALVLSLQLYCSTYVWLYCFRPLLCTRVTNAAFFPTFFFLVRKMNQCFCWYTVQPCFHAWWFCLRTYERFCCNKTAKKCVKNIWGSISWILNKKYFWKNKKTNYSNYFTLSGLPSKARNCLRYMRYRRNKIYNIYVMYI